MESTSDLSRFGGFSEEKDRYYIEKAIEVSRKARESGNTPFGAILVDQNGTNLIEQGNIEITEKDCTGHAETALMRKASKLFNKEFLWNCTLYSTAEPCAMCSGAIYWGNVGRVVYGISEKSILSLTGSHPQNPTFSVPCRGIFAGGQKSIVVIGPIADPELEKKIVEVHRGYWN
ncbi:MAG TPA: tRNA-specific adenosine deaminase [Firmicutes bacterium]|nr:tRNA-specific adenosine deaminase [Bacillota bacterium]